jgi:adenylate cyclase
MHDLPVSAGLVPASPSIGRPPSPRPPERRLRLVRPGDAGTAPSPVSRLAVILAADVVGYARHMAEDEIGTHARLTAILRDLVAPRLARHGGRLVKGTGDGFLAEFGCATRAAWFAVEFQRAARAWNARRRWGRRLEFRVGINLGDVIVEGQDVFGHSVNIAARLESLAEPGGVLVSYPVCAAIRDPGLLFEAVGELVLKNPDGTVRGCRLRPSGEGRPVGLGEAASWRGGSPTSPQVLVERLSADPELPRHLRLADPLSDPAAKL